MLLQHDVDLCRDAFSKLDPANNGFLQPDDLRRLYKELGIKDVTELDLRKTLTAANLDANDEFSFEEVLQIIEMHNRPENTHEDSEGDTLLAFMSMGGLAGGEGQVDVSKLMKTCSYFGLTIDIESVVKDLDTDGDGKVSFEEFRAILTSPQKEDSSQLTVAPEHSLADGLRKGGKLRFLPDTIQQSSRLTSADNNDDHDD